MGEATKHAGRWIFEAPCPGCDRPLWALTLSADLLPPLKLRIGLCGDCVYRALVRMAIVLHGDLSDEPHSSRHAGHDQRMHSHAMKHAYFST